MYSVYTDWSVARETDVQSRSAEIFARTRIARHMPLSLREISELSDPDARDSAELDRIEWLVGKAMNRQKHLHGVAVADPDSWGASKLELIGHGLIERKAARLGHTKSTKLERLVSELRGVLRAYDELPLDEWLELRARYTR